MGKSRFELKNGIVYVSVTSALGIVRMPFLETWRGKYGNEYCQKVINESVAMGKEFHRYAELIDKGQGNDVKVETLEGGVKNMVENYLEWFFENVEEVLLVEEQVYNDEYYYKGIPDLVAKLKDEKLPAIIDRKTGKSVDIKDAYQLSAYKEAIIKDKKLKIGKRIVLHFNKGESFDVINFDEKRDHAEDFRCFCYAKELFLNYNKDSVDSFIAKSN